MRITFLLPGVGNTPVGGYKVAYEYANKLATLGHKVTIVHPALLTKSTPAGAFPKKIARYIQRRIDGSYRPNHWFPIHPEIRLLWVFSLHQRHIPDGEVIIATAWQTAEWACTYDICKGTKFYLIHDYEHYMVANPESKNRMAATYTCGMHNIVTSPAGSEMLQSCGAPIAAYIPNGIDFTIFKLTTPIESDGRTFIGFPSRPEVFKGTRDAVAALDILRSKLDDNIKVWSFGGRKPDYIPAWITYFERPSDEHLCKLHNQTKIFVTPSHYEGWGLPGAEAQACGAALVSTDHGGVRAYAEHGRTALLSAPKDVDALAENVCQLVDNMDLRQSIAQAGYQHIQQFTWGKAVDALEGCLASWDVPYEELT